MIFHFKYTHGQRVDSVYSIVCFSSFSLLFSVWAVQDCSRWLGPDTGKYKINGVCVTIYFHSMLAITLE